MRTDTSSNRHDRLDRPDLEISEPVDVLARIGASAPCDVETSLGGSLWDLEGCATAFCLGADIFGTMWNLTALRYGPAGVVADVAEPIDPGSKISLGFEAPGYVAKRGEVIACRELGDSYRVAIRFEERLAA
jgi:hypothetical protein